MGDERWAAAIMVMSFIVMRILDTVLPKGYISKYVGKYLKPRDDDTPKE